MPTTPSLNNVKLGACTVTYNGNNLGYTKGGVDVTLSTLTKEVKVDQIGDTLVDEYIQGRGIMIKIPMAESDLQKLVLAIPGATLITDIITPTKLNIQIGTSIGTSLRSIAAALTLHPVGYLVTDLSNDVNIPLAAPSGNVTFAYNADNERVYTVEFKGFPDQTTGLLVNMGDPSAKAV